MGLDVARAALAALALTLTAQARQDGAQAVNAAFADGRYAEALEIARALEDPVLAAEWASYLFSVAGDLPGALRESRVGLRTAPLHLGLLTQALNASLSLGLEGSASELAERLHGASMAGGDAGQIATAEELRGLARDLAEREALAARGIARARTLVLSGLAACAAALFWLARPQR